MRETHCMNHKWIAWNSKSNGLRILWHMNLKTTKTNKQREEKKITFAENIWIRHQSEAIPVSCVMRIYCDLRVFVCKRINYMPFLSKRYVLWFQKQHFFLSFFFSVKGFQCFGAQNIHCTFWYCFCFFCSSFDFIIENHWSYLKRKRITFGKQCSQNSGAKRTWVWCVLYR